MTQLSKYSDEISKIRQSINYSLLESESNNSYKYDYKYKDTNELKKTIDIKNVSKSYKILSELEDPAELDMVMDEPKEKYKKQILGLMKEDDKKNSFSKSIKSDRVTTSKSIGLDTSSRLGMSTYIYSEGREWTPANPSLIWRKKKSTDNTTTLASSISNQRVLMNSPGIIRELENELGPVKTHIKLPTTGEKLQDINVGNISISKEVWKDEPLNNISKINQLERDERTKSKEQFNSIYDKLGVPAAEIITLSKYGDIKLPVRSVINMSNFASEKVEKNLLESEGALEVKLLNLVDPINLKEHHLTQESKDLSFAKKDENEKKIDNDSIEKEKILFGDKIDKKKEERYLKDIKRLRMINTNFEKHLGIKLSGKVCLDNIGESVISILPEKNNKKICKKFKELRRQLGWDNSTIENQSNNEIDADIYGNVIDNKTKFFEAIVNRLIENTTLYPCFDEVLFDNTFRIHPDKNINHVSLITDHLDATSVPDSSELLLNIHRRQYTPPLAENFPKGLPSQVQDPRLIWQKEFLKVPYEITADLIRKIKKGFWDEITNDIAKSSYGSISINSAESVTNIRKFILNELNYNPMYSVDEPFDVSPPILAPIDRGQCNKDGTKPQLINNKLILTPKQSVLSSTIKAVGSGIIPNLSSFGIKTSSKENQKPSGANDPQQNKVKNNASVINYIPDCELYETALWNRYEFPYEDSNKGIIRKFKLGKTYDFEPLTRENVINVSNEWNIDLTKQAKERQEGIDMLIKSQNKCRNSLKRIEFLNRVIEEEYNSLGNKEFNKLNEIFKESESTELYNKTQYSDQDHQKNQKNQKNANNLLFNAVNNLGGNTLLTNAAINMSNINTEESPDTLRFGNTQNNIFKKIRRSQRTRRNRGNGDMSNNEDYDDDDDSSIRDEDSEEFDDFSSDNEEDYKLICENINVVPWEPTNLMITKNLFKSMNSLFVTLSSVIFRDNGKSKCRVEVYELCEHGLIVWMGRDPIGIKEKVLTCCSNNKGKLRVKGGIYITPDTIISPIEPCTEIPGNFIFSVTGISLSQLIFKNGIYKQLEQVRKYAMEYQEKLSSKINNNTSETKIFKRNTNNQVLLPNNGKNETDESSILNLRHNFGISVDTDTDLISRYDKKMINNIEITNLVPALKSNKITGNNTILIATNDDFLKGILPLSLKSTQHITIRFSLRRNRLILWRSIKCQVWKVQYIDYCFKNSYIPSKKMIYFISNAFSKINSSNSFDMSGIKFQEHIFAHCISVALSRKEPKEMIFRGCYMGDEGFSTIFPLLRQSKSLGKLDLGMNNLTARSLPLILEVVKGSGCKKLYLDFNNLGPNKTKREFAIFFKHILFSTSVEHLNLSRNKINGRCIDFLDTIIDNLSSKNRTLDTLIWCSNGNTQPEIETLLLALQPCCINLSKVILGGNPIERIDAFRRRFNPIKIFMEDITLHYLNRSSTHLISDISRDQVPQRSKDQI